MRFLVVFALALGWLSVPVRADEEWKYRFFTRVVNAKTGKPLEKPITAEIKIVSKIDDQTFQAIIRDNEKTFTLEAKLFSKADQDYLRKWNPIFAIDLRDFPLETVLEQSGYEVVALQKASLAYYVPVYLNGEKLTFLVDTGAMGTVIDERTARKLQMILQPSRVMMSGLSGVPRRAMKAKYKSLKIGHVPVSGGAGSVFVIDLPGGSSRRMDGILGFELLSKLSGMIDYKANRMFLKPVPEKKPDPVPALEPAQK
jgi:hypothetical protein